MRTRTSTLILAALLAATAFAAPKKKRPPRPPPTLDLIPIVPLPVKKEPPKEPPRLAITTPVAGAKVFVDDKPLGETPLPPVIGLAAGRHQVRIARPGYVEYTADVELVAGETRNLEVQLVALGGFLTVRSAALGATAHLDGAALGGLPIVRHEVPAGAHTVVIKAPGLDSYAEKVLVKAGELTTIEAELRPPRTEPSLTASGEAVASRRVAASLPVETVEGGEPAGSGDKLWTKWWVWTAAGAVVLAAATTTVVVASQPGPAVTKTPSDIEIEKGVKLSGCINPPPGYTCPP